MHFADKPIIFKTVCHWSQEISLFWYLTCKAWCPGRHKILYISCPCTCCFLPLLTSPSDVPQVCREFQRGNCKRSEGECRFAHPPEHVQVEGGEGAVTVCMDHVKGRCQRDQCRYFHPPQHLQAQLKAQQARPVRHTLYYPILLSLFFFKPTHPVLLSAAAALSGLGSSRALWEGWWAVARRMVIGRCTNDHEKKNEIKTNIN